MSIRGKLNGHSEHISAHVNTLHPTRSKFNTCPEVKRQTYLSPRVFSNSSLSSLRRWNHFGASVTRGPLSSSGSRSTASVSSRKRLVSSRNSESKELTILRRFVSTRACPISRATSLLKWRTSLPLVY